MTTILIVEKTGTLKTLSVKTFAEEELFKKCGFKKADGFQKQIEWPVKLDGKKYVVQVFAKSEGKANCENKYDFPPPIDTTLFFGSCAIVGYILEGGKSQLFNLTIEFWNKVYEKLFGGFEDLASTMKEDEEEEDELANIPSHKKTKQGYLKDGFVVDTSESDDENSYGSSNSDSDENESSYEDTDSVGENELIIEDVGSELTEEEYDEEDEDD
jgi:hypothetical protein